MLAHEGGEIFDREEIIMALDSRTPARTRRNEAPRAEVGHAVSR